MNQEELEFDRTPLFSPTQSAPSRPSPSQPPHNTATSLRLHYTVAMSVPETHLFEVALTIAGADQHATIDLKMPVWTPGSYLVREYSRHVQNFVACAGRDRAISLPWRKLGKNYWQVDSRGNAEITVTYQVYANELTVRTNHLDGSHGYFNGAALFFYVPGYEQQPIQVTIVPPQADWQIATPLPAIAGTPHTFEAANFDTLVDSPFEIGQQQVYEFVVQNKPHDLVVWGTGNLQPERLLPDIEKIIQVEAELFEGLPYDRYLFLLHLATQGFGGLEHKNCCSLIYSRFGFRQKDKYDRFLQLVAHEFFHLWNVKRIRPQALEVFDYEQENYTPSLWFSEGTTSFYDLILPYRAGVYDVGTYLNALSREITRYLTTPGRLVQPLSESSFDAWIKLYRPDANSPNSQISYYLKGSMVSLLLDLLIRERHQNGRSLDDVMRQMWQRFGQPEIGFTPAELQQVIETVAGTDLTDFFAAYLHGTDELPLGTYLNWFGLRLQVDGNNGDGVPSLGMVVKTENGRELIKFVEMASPAQRAGMDSGDELLAIDGIRVSADQLSDRLRDYRPGDTIDVSWFHQDELFTRSVTLAAPRPTRYQVIAVENPTLQQAENFMGWLGVPLATI